MSSNDYIFQANVKLGQHLINIVGISPEEFQTNLQWVTTNAAGIVSTIAALEGAYAVKPLTANVASTQVVNDTPAGQWADRSHAQGQQQPQQAYQQPAVQQAPPNPGPVPSCQHGAIKLVPGGISKNTGKAYNAFYSCTGPRESQCKTVNT